MTVLSKTEIFEKAASLRESGIYNEPLTARWNKVIEERAEQDTPICAVAALNNSDSDMVLLSLLKDHPARILDGLCMAAAAVDAEGRVLVLPAGCEALGEELAPLCEDREITVEYGLVNVRRYRGSAIHHFQTLLALAQSVSGDYEPGAWLAVKQAGTVGELKKFPFGTPLSHIVGETEGIRAFAIGPTLYAPASLSMTVEEDTPLANGVITLYPDSCCLICEAEKVLMNYRTRSCGKCTFCREGLIQLHTITKEITEGKGKKESLDMMAEIGSAMTFSCPCDLGQTGSLFTLSSMELFMEEYDDHIKRKKCKNNVCSAFMNIYIDPAACTGCEDCVDVCPADCIEGKSGFIHMIDSFDCTKCGKCIEACGEEAIIRTTGRVPKLPTRLVKCGKFR